MNSCDASLGDAYYLAFVCVCVSDSKYLKTYFELINLILVDAFPLNQGRNHTILKNTSNWSKVGRVGKGKYVPLG